MALVYSFRSNLNKMSENKCEGEIKFREDQCNAPPRGADVLPGNWVLSDRTSQVFSLIRWLLGGLPAVPARDPRLGAPLQGWRVRRTWRAAIEALGDGEDGEVGSWWDKYLNEEGGLHINLGILQYKLAWKGGLLFLEAVMWKVEPTMSGGLCYTHTRWPRTRSRASLITAAIKLKVYLEDRKLIALRSRWETFHACTFLVFVSSEQNL